MKQLVITERENLVAIANAVRANSDITSEISLDGIASGINYVANYVAANTGGIDTSDATATAGDILQGETAYADGQKITGTFTLDSELTAQDDLIAQIQTALEGKAGGSAEPVLQDKSVTPSTTTQTVTPDSGYDGLSEVTVNAMPTATQATPSITVNSSGLITATATQTAGYVSAGTKSGTKQLTTQAAKTITPSTSSQTAVAKNVYTTGAITVGAIPSTYVKPTTTKAATTYTPTTSNQTIAAGTYCSGAQTIKGDSNLVAGNIKSGVSIFGVDGAYEGSGSSGDSSIETCNVSLKIKEDIGSGEAITTLLYTTIENGTIVGKYGHSRDLLRAPPGLTTGGYWYLTGTLLCVKNTILYLLDENYNSPSFATSGTTIESVDAEERIFAAKITGSTSITAE